MKKLLLFLLFIGSVGYSQKFECYRTAFFSEYGRYWFYDVFTYENDEKEYFIFDGNDELNVFEIIEKDGKKFVEGFEIKEPENCKGCIAFPLKELVGVDNYGYSILLEDLENCNYSINRFKEKNIIAP